MRNLKLDVELFQRRLEMKKQQWANLKSHLTAVGTLVDYSIITPKIRCWMHLRQIYYKKLVAVELEQQQLMIELDCLELDARTL